MLHDLPTGHPTRIAGHERLQVAAFFQAGNLGLNFALLLGAALWFRQAKARLTPRKGVAMVATYAVIQAAFAAIVFTSWTK